MVQNNNMLQVFYKSLHQLTSKSYYWNHNIIIAIKITIWDNHNNGQFWVFDRSGSPNSFWTPVSFVCPIPIHWDCHTIIDKCFRVENKFEHKPLPHYSLPFNLQEPTNTDTFKKQLKTHLFKLAYEWRIWLCWCTTGHLTLSLPAYHCRQWKSWRIYASTVAIGLKCKWRCEIM